MRVEDLMKNVVYCFIHISILDQTDAKSCYDHIYFNVGKKKHLIVKELSNIEKITINYKNIVM